MRESVSAKGYYEMYGERQLGESYGVNGELFVRINSVLFGNLLATCRELGSSELSLTPRATLPPAKSG